MAQDDTVQQLQECLDWLKSLVPQPGDALEQGDIEELSAAFEQLQLIQVELRHQHVELAEARGQLEGERSRNRDLFELASDAYLITDAQGVICEANRASIAMLRMERRFLIGKPLHVFVPADQRQAFRSRVLHASIHQQMQWRLKVQPRDGEAIDVAATVEPIVEPPGQSLALRWSLRDITSIVRDVAEEANRSKDEFLATISHELRTPLNVVLGWTFRLRAHSLEGAHIDRAIEIIDRNARRQLHLVEELLDSARIATGRFVLELEPCEFGPMVRSAVEEIEGKAAAKDIRITCDIRDGIHVRANSRRIRQIAWSLLSNALKFTSEHGSVHVSLLCEPGSAVFSVADSGVGIAAQALPHVFEPFWQAERSTRRVRGGLGLGLSIVRRLVKLHGGDVEAASQGEEHGATFTVRLPLLRDSAIGRLTPRSMDPVYFPVDRVAK